VFVGLRRGGAVPQTVACPLEGGDIDDGLVTSIVDVVPMAHLADVERIGKDPGNLAAAELAERTSRSSIRWPIVVFDEFLGMVYRPSQALPEPPGVGYCHHRPDRRRGARHLSKMNRTISASCSSTTNCQ
jgi:hypothetical protein